MTQTVTGKVLKLEANKFGFYGIAMKDDNDQWVNVGLGIKQPPKTFKKGDTVTVSYDPNNYNNIVGKPEVVAEGGSAPQGGSSQGKGGGYNKGGYNKGGYNKGNDDARQEMIVRQSGINYALQAVLHSAKKTEKPDDIIAAAIQMAENTILPYVLKGKEGVPQILGGEEKKEAPAKQEASKQQQQQQTEEPEDDIPF